MKNFLTILLSSTILLMNPYKMAYAGFIKSPESPTNEFQTYLENRNIQSFSNEKIEQIYASENKKLYSSLDSLEENPNNSLKSILNNSFDNTFSPNDIKFVNDFVFFIKNSQKNIVIDSDLLKKIECRFAFNNLKKLQDLKCAYSEISTEPLKKYMEQGGSMIINDHFFDQDNLPTTIYSSDEKYQIHFISNTHSSYMSLNFLNKEISEFKIPVALISGSCGDFKINDDQIISEKNKIYFSASCIQDTFRPKKPESWLQKNKNTVVIVSGIALIAAGIYLKDKRVVFEKQVFSF